MVKNCTSYSFTKGRRQYREDAIKFNLEDGISGLILQLSSVICIPKCEKKKCVSNLNSAVNALYYIYENSSQVAVENKISKKECFCLLKCTLLHKEKEVRAGGLRILRYLIRNQDDVKAFYYVNITSLVLRCVDIVLDNEVERIQGLRLVKHVLMIYPDIFPEDFARCIISIAKGGAEERDNLLRTSLCILNKLAVLNTDLFIKCDGITVTLYNILDCALPRINEALMGTLLYITNFPHWRQHCKKLHTILAPLSNYSYRHTYELPGCSRSEERELRIQASCMAILVSLRSWSGLMLMCQPTSKAWHTLVALLYSAHEPTRRVIVGILYELFRIPLNTCTTSYEDAIYQHSETSTYDLDLWRLNEGFVAAEAKALLPPVAVYSSSNTIEQSQADSNAPAKPNLVLNHLSLVLYALISVDLFPTLCEVIVSSSLALSVTTTVLLAELLHLAHQNLPLSCCLLCHTLPRLAEKSISGDAVQRSRAVQAISALSKFSMLKLYKTEVASSVYLEHVMDSYPKFRRKQLRIKKEFMTFSKWLGRNHDEGILHALYDSHIFKSSRFMRLYDWKLITCVLRWPTKTLLDLGNNTYETFVRYLLDFFKPASSLFSAQDKKYISKEQVETLLLFCQFMLKLSDNGNSKYLEEFLQDVNSELAAVACDIPNHQLVFSPNHLNSTASQYYFLALGKLSQIKTGYEMLQKLNIFQKFHDLLNTPYSGTYSKLIVTCLDYSIEGLNRVILKKVLTGCQEPARLYATQWLCALIRVEAEGFSQWGIDMLIHQLYDESRLVVNVALDVIDEACDNQEYLEAIVKNPPSLTHLGDKGQLLLAKFLSSPLGFQTYASANTINNLFENWTNVYNLKYVTLVQKAVSDSLTHHQPGEDGAYGRRTGSKHIVHDVYLPPHLYGSLTSYKDGFFFLTQDENVTRLIEIVKVCDTSDQQKIFSLKAAIWALGHIGLSDDGVSFLNDNGIVSEFVNLCATCAVYSIRATCFNALCLIATTWAGSNLLKCFGWDCVKRNHHKKWQCGGNFYLDTLLSEEGSLAEQDVSDTKRTEFSVGCESEPESEAVSLTDKLSLEESSPIARRAQTLPPGVIPPFSYKHIRSLSDCGSHPDEVVVSSYEGDKQPHSASWHSSWKFRKFMASIRRKAQRHRDSSGSKASNSSITSDYLPLLLHSSCKLKEKPEYTSFSDERIIGDADNLCTFSSESYASDCDDPSINQENYLSSHTEGKIANYAKLQLENRLTPISSRGSISVSEPQSIPINTNEARKRKISSRSVGVPLYFDTSADQDNLTLLSSQSYNALRTISQHRRLVSESSGNGDAKSSFAFMSSSLDRKSEHLDVKPSNYFEMLRSPSACSEASSHTAFTWKQPVHACHKNVKQNYSVPEINSSGQCYLGMAVPYNLDLLLYDSTLDDEKEEGPVEQFLSSTINQSNNSHNSATELDLRESLQQMENMKLLSPVSLREKLKSSMDSSLDNELQHCFEKCFNCFSLYSTDSYICIVDPEKYKENEILSWNEILKFVKNLCLASSPPIRKSNESGLLIMKQKCPKLFEDPCLYSEVCFIISSFNYNLNTRRFIQELFIKVDAVGIFEEADRILANAKATCSKASTGLSQQFDNTFGASSQISFELEDQLVLSDVSCNEDEDF